MKFLDIGSLAPLQNALNFKTLDLSVSGGCDLYTTKAAGTDKKLYRNIENSLESQYESLLRLSASVSSPDDEDLGHPSLNLSRSSPFGPLSQVSSRRTFAYLIATLNASHPDYDFSNNLRPSDFKQERSLKAVMNNIDSTFYNLRPGSGMTLQVPTQTSYAMASMPATSQTWGPHMWSIIDKEMNLNECTVYCWAPPDDPFDGEDASIWNLNYFFFNKERKRVAYIYVRGVPVVTHSPRQRMGMTKRSASGYDLGANKRAKYWLGSQAANITNEDAEWSNNGADSEEFDINFEDDEDYDEYDDEADDESDNQDYKAPVRGVSEDIAASMDMDY